MKRTRRLHDFSLSLEVRPRVFSVEKNNDPLEARDQRARLKKKKKKYPRPPFSFFFSRLRDFNDRLFRDLVKVTLVRL
jgi:hypothetical protein